MEDSEREKVVHYGNTNSKTNKLALVKTQIQDKKLNPKTVNL